MGGASGDKVNVGAVLPLSGQLAGIDKKIKQAYQLAQADINRDGGIDGKQPELLYADHLSEPDVGAQAAERLV